MPAKITVRRIYNTIMPFIFIPLKRVYLPYRPAKISIESGNICNLRCPLCPTGQQDKGARKGFLRPDVFKKVLDELGKDLTLIRLYNWGEPLLHKDLLDMVQYARAKGVNVKISTNLSMRLDDNQIKALLKAGLEKIYVSCNGASQATYLKYHVGGNFDLVMDNMQRLAREKQKIPGCLTRLVWLFHVFKHNVNEIEPAKELARKIGVKIKISKMRPDMGKEPFETAGMAIERDRDWIPDDPEYKVVPEERQNRLGCKFPWTETMINWDGSVLPCCAVYNETYAFGNILEKPFNEIWNNEMYIAARREILGLKNGRETICHICKKSGYLHGG